MNFKGRILKKLDLILFNKSKKRLSISMVSKYCLNEAFQEPHFNVSHYISEVREERFKKMIYLSVGHLGPTGPSLEDLDSRDFFCVYVFALSNVTKAATKPEAPELVLTDPAV